MTLALVIVIASVGISAVASGLRDRQLLSEGVLVDARIESISGGMYKRDRSTQIEADFSFLLPGETERRTLSKQKLEPRPEAKPISRGDTLPIRVDPKNPSKWTDRVTPASWLVVLAVPLLLTPPAIVLALITATVRKRMLSLYTDGVRQTATIDEAHRSPLIPGQKMVKLSVGGKTLTAAYPDRLGPIAPGDAVEVIVDDPADAGRALVAAAYV